MNAPRPTPVVPTRPLLVSDKSFLPRPARPGRPAYGEVLSEALVGVLHDWLDNPSASVEEGPGKVAC
jgi:hypothetical protein